MTIHSEYEIPLDPEVCWQAIVARDRAYDSRFVYAVRSTGIYCRPGCASRRPRRENVQFFAAADFAETAGFRPCKRCQPQATVASDARAELVQRACTCIDTQLDTALTLEQLGAAVGSSPYHLQRTFKAVLGVSPRQYRDELRKKRLKAQLKRGDNVTEALYAAGYSSSSRLYERADSQLGMTPASYRKGGAGTQIGYSIVECALGLLLVAATERGVCMVSLAGPAEAAMLTQALVAEFPAAQIVRDDDRLQPWTTALVAHLAGRQPDLGLPLDVQSTAFQRRVWQLLQAIPYGETRTYSQLARELGQPTATRAVARACATNPVSLVVPCHRAIGVDGSLRGYRWGIERKRALLEREQRVAAEVTGDGSSRT